MAKARGSHLRVHFKNTHETAMAIKGLSFKKARSYLQRVIAHHDIVPFRVFTGGPAHHAQDKKYGGVAGRWPEKSCRFLLDLLKNAESNAEMKGLDTDKLVVSHIQVNRAPRGRRRGFGAHGRTKHLLSSPCHIELFLEPQDEVVAKAGKGVKADDQLVQGATIEVQ